MFLNVRYVYVMQVLVTNTEVNQIVIAKTKWLTGGRIMPPCCAAVAIEC